MEDITDFARRPLAVMNRNCWMFWNHWRRV